MQLFIELWSTKPAWLALSQEERAVYMQNVREALEAMQEGGIEILGWGAVDPATGHTADYNFFAVYRMQNPEQAAAFEAAVAAAGWYEFFEQINACGELVDAHTVIDRLIDV